MDYIKNINTYLKYAEQGCASAQYKLGDCYNYGFGADKNEVEAVKWYCKAAEQGLAEAQYRLGDCYNFGWGVDNNEAEAVGTARQPNRDWQKRRIISAIAITPVTELTKIKLKRLNGTAKPPVKAIISEVLS